MRTGKNIMSPIEYPIMRMPREDPLLGDISAAIAAREIFERNVLPDILHPCPDPDEHRIRDACMDSLIFLRREESFPYQDSSRAGWYRYVFILYARQRITDVYALMPVQEEPSAEAGMRLLSYDWVRFDIHQMYEIVLPVTGGYNGIIWINREEEQLTSAFACMMWLVEGEEDIVSLRRSLLTGIDEEDISSVYLRLVRVMHDLTSAVRRDD
jgi:hypothetical protein